MKRLTLIAGLIGLTVAIVLIVHEGYQAILQVLGIAGWGLLWLLPFHLVPQTLDAHGWQILLRPSDPRRHARLPFLVWVAAVREAVNRLLPVASVGGEVVGIRLVLLRPLSGAAVSASVVLEILLGIVNQYLFVALGLILLVTLLHGNSTSNALFVGLGVSLPLPILLYLLLRHGAVFSRIERAALRLLGDTSRLAGLLSNSGELDRALRALFAQPLRIARTMAWQLAAMIVGSFETWLALWLLGHPVPAWQAVTLESLTLAINSFAFFVPGAIGVQEAGLVVFGGLVGLPADVSVALSLAKRLRQIGLGVPALLSWQWVEGRGLRRTLSESKSDG